MGKFIDLTGMRFGYLVVVERAEDYITPSKQHHTQWKCRCDCGNIINVAGTSLKRGATISCGCYNSKQRLEKCKSRLQDLTGKKFGYLTVLERTDDYISPKGHRQVRWLCKCECGKIVPVIGDMLKSGRIKSCGCKSNETLKNKYEKQDNQFIRRRFGRLIVLKKESRETEGSRKRSYWLCQCDCGKQVVVMRDSLISGATQSCGCLKRDNPSNFTDLTGMRFGHLTVISKSDYKIGKGITWECRCDCGDKTYVTTYCLTHDKIVSCGCIKSKMEYDVKSYLNSNSIPYESQKKFEDLLGVGCGQLSYDFYLPEYNCLIECQGKQHYEPIDIFGGVDFFEIQKEHDERKRKYAQLHHYNLLEIKYTEKNQIEAILSKSLVEFAKVGGCLT